MRNKIQIRIPRSAEGRVIRISPAAEAVLADYSALQDCLYLRSHHR